LDFICRRAGSIRRVMGRGWSWGNLGGDFRAKKRTGKKNVYLLTVAVHTVEMVMEE
jgi:hypothetical protein